MQSGRTESSERRTFLGLEFYSWSVQTWLFSCVTMSSCIAKKYFKNTAVGDIRECVLEFFKKNLITWSVSLSIIPCVKWVYSFFVSFFTFVMAVNNDLTLFYFPLATSLCSFVFSFSCFLQGSSQWITLPMWFGFSFTTNALCDSCCHFHMEDDKLHASALLLNYNKLNHTCSKLFKK